MTSLPELEALITAVAADAKSEEPLERLAAAARVRDTLDDLAEGVLDHFVQEARQAGCSWSQIGAAFGVTKQAAQQRHTATGSVARRLLSRVSGRRRSGSGSAELFSAGPFRRFTPRAREAVVLAEKESEGLSHDYIGTEHLLLALLRLGDGVAAKALASLGVPVDDVREAVVDAVGPCETRPAGHVPFTPRAKKVLELSLREAEHLKHNYVGTEHILLGLAREKDGVAMRILQSRGVDASAIRAAVLGLLDPPLRDRPSV